MSLISLPASFPVRHIDWTLDRPAQVNRSAYSGARQVVANPWHGKWSASVQLAPIVGEKNFRAIRGFFASLKGQINPFLLPATEGPQHSSGNSSASGSASQGANSITLAVPAETVTNGTFGSNTTGWTGANCSLSVVSGMMRLTSTLGAGYEAIAYQDITTTPGATYTLTGTWANLSGGAYPQIYVTNGSSTLTITTSGGSVTFTATGTSVRVGAEFNLNAVGNSCDFDNISMKEAGTATPPLTAGMFATVSLPSGNYQMVILTADISGSTITFEPALREAISAGARVETVNPFCMVALTTTSFKWSADPGQLYNISFEAEEAF